MKTKTSLGSGSGFARSRAPLCVEGGTCFGLAGPSRPASRVSTITSRFTGISGLESRLYQGDADMGQVQKTVKYRT
jgi:hypothetical protein